MSTCSLTVDGKPVDVSPGATVLAAASLAGVGIPTLCNPEGCRNTSSCLVCLVRDLKTGRMIPSCSTPASDGMEIDASSAVVIRARKDSLELLLSEHAGDCIAPCARACPAGTDVPAVLDLVRKGRLEDALLLLLSALPLPETSSRLCGGYCEKACRSRETRGHAIPFRDLKKILSLSVSPMHAVLEAFPVSRGRVLVAGSGCAGLSAACTLLLAGFDVTVADQSYVPGGNLLRLPESVLPPDVLSRDIDLIFSFPRASFLGIGSGGAAGADIGRTGGYDAMVVEDEAVAEFFSAVPTGIKIDPGTGNGKPSMKSMAAGRDAALELIRETAGALFSTDRSVEKLGGHGSKHSPSTLDRLSAEERRRMLAERTRTGESSETGDDLRFDAVLIASLCHGCGCSGAATCSLRRLCIEYGVRSPSWTALRKADVPYARAGFLHESALCIRCGRCVREAKRRDGEAGFSFAGRGLSSRLIISEEGPVSPGFIAAVCSVCPTAALRPEVTP